MRELPPEKTVGDTKSVGNALAAFLTKGGAPVQESRVPPSVDEETSSGSTTLGALRAQAAPAMLRLSEDGVPEMAWDPATRFAGSPAPPRRSLRPSVSPVAGQASHAPTQAAQQPAPLQESGPSLAALTGGALRIGKGL